MPITIFTYLSESCKVWEALWFHDLLFSLKKLNSSEKVYSVL